MAVGNATIQVLYTVTGGKSNTAITVVKVQQPGSLKVEYNQTSAVTCDAFGWPYNTQNRQILYSVRDTSGAALPAAQVSVAETLSFVNNGCQVPAPASSTFLTDGNGVLLNPDNRDLDPARDFVFHHHVESYWANHQHHDPRRTGPGSGNSRR